MKLICCCERSHLKTGIIFICSMVLLLVVSFLAVRFGSVTLDSDKIFDAMISRFHGTRPKSALTSEIIWDMRIPRLTTGLLVGSALSVSGATLQSLVRNPVADPYILGAGPGAAFGAVTAMLLPAGFFTLLGVPFAAFCGAMVALVAVLLLGRSQGALSPLRMVLAGIAVGYLFNALTNFVQLRANPNRLNGVLHWLLGSLGGVTWADLWLPSLIICGSITVVLFFSRQLDALSLGDETAYHLGVNVKKVRLMLLIFASILTGVSVSLAGGVVFIGLLVPHIGRMLLGSSHQKILPFSVIFGAFLMVTVDLVSRVVDAPNELPLSIFTALLGVPFFLWLLNRES